MNTVNQSEPKIAKTQLAKMDQKNVPSQPKWSKMNQNSEYTVKQIF